MRPNSVLLLIATMVAGFLAPRPTLAIVFSGDQVDHVVHPGASAYNLNLDGVALLGTDSPGSTSIDDLLVAACTGALITDRHVLSAAHCFDEDHDGQIDSLIRSFPFVAAFELPEEDVLLRVNTDAIRMPPDWPASETDIAILELVESAPPEIPRYELYARRDEIGKQIVISGYGATGFGETGVDVVASESFIKRVGLNRLETFFDDRELEIGYDFDSGQEANNKAFLFQGIVSDLGLGTQEVLASNGDSGGPVFIDGAIAGVSAFNAWPFEGDINDEFDQSWGEAAFATRVSSFQNFILDATEGEAVFVPEPLVPLPLAVFGVLASALRQRRSPRTQGQP